MKKHFCLALAALSLSLPACYSREEYEFNGKIGNEQVLFEPRHDSGHGLLRITRENGMVTEFYLSAMTYDNSAISKVCVYRGSSKEKYQCIDELNSTTNSRRFPGILKESRRQVNETLDKIIQDKEWPFLKLILESEEEKQR